LAFETVWLYFTIIETKGKNGILPLEEIAALFDGEEARREVAEHRLEMGERNAAAQHVLNAEDPDKKGDELDHLEDVKAI
jgi:hypothetical protein